MARAQFLTGIMLLYVFPLPLQDVSEMYQFLLYVNERSTHIFLGRYKREAFLVKSAM